MKRLKSKVFFIIFAILTISVISFIAVFNIWDYMPQRNSVEDSLDIASYNGKNAEGEKPDEGGVPPEIPSESSSDEGSYDAQMSEENIKFMDSVIYTVLLDEENHVKGVINHSNDELSSNEISSIAEGILESKTIEELHIGNLYLEDYSYAYVEGNSITIADNGKVKDMLWNSLKNSAFIFIALEAVILLVCVLLTGWIIKPVKESFDRQKRFIADASHELKTPLSVIMASSESLEDEPGETKWIKNIKNEAERMNLLIMDLLRLAAGESETMSMEEGNLSKTVELSVLTFEGRAFESHIKLRYDIEENIKLNMNENSIKQLLEILLDNAVRHSEPDGTVKVILKKHGNNIKLFVENRGEAIPKGEEEKIFQRFYRIDKARNRSEGRYGLGLAIARNITEHHNGKISAFSEDGITTFKVSFDGR